MDIKKFPDITEKELQDLVTLDTELIARYGLSYSNESWDTHNFIYSLPDKNDLSYVLFENGFPTGFCIASTKAASVYIHRFAVRSTTKGTSRLFLDELLSRYGTRDVVLMVNIVNSNAIAFYHQSGFEIVRNETLIYRYIAKGLTFNNDTIHINKDYQCYLMQRK